MAGPDGSVEAGQIADLPEGQASDLVKRGFAVAISEPNAEPPEPPFKEVATSRPATETTSADKPRRSRGAKQPAADDEWSKE